MGVKTLVTGAAGFIGHHVVEHLLETTGWELVLLDKIDSAGNLNRLANLWDPERMSFVYHDLQAPINPLLQSQIGHIDNILHLAASSHVDRSILDPASFVLNNVLGTAHLLDFARIGGSRTLYFSTDEVFGPAPEGRAFKEWDRYHAGNPYAATKAGAEELCLAYSNTYKLPVLVTHCMNVFGERQHPEKYVPSTIRKVLHGERVMVHADSTRTRPGSRFYIHARDVAAAALFVLEQGELGEKYNIVGEREVSNLEMAQLIAGFVGQPLRYELVDFHSSRPGHDLRYALDGTKLRDLGWKPPFGFENALERTVKWTLSHPEWLGGKEEKRT